MEPELTAWRAALAEVERLIAETEAAPYPGSDRFLLHLQGRRESLEVYIEMGEKHALDRSVSAVICRRCNRGVTGREMTVQGVTWRYADEWDLMTESQRIADMAGRYRR